MWLVLTVASPEGLETSAVFKLGNVIDWTVIKLIEPKIRGIVEN